MSGRHGVEYVARCVACAALSWFFGNRLPISQTMLALIPEVVSGSRVTHSGLYRGTSLIGKGTPPRTTIRPWA